MAKVLVRNERTGLYDWVEKDSSQTPRRTTGGQTFTECRPFISASAACHPLDVDEFNGLIEELGLSASLHHMPDGTLRCTSQGALNVYLRERGMLDADACYSQHAGT